MSEDYRTSTPEGAAGWAYAHAEPYDGRPSRAELAADEDDHACTENSEDYGDGPVCGVCRKELDPRDLACPGCQCYPCRCDELYERYRDNLLLQEEL